MEPNLKPLEKLLQTAKDLGCPREQVERFLASQYVPYPWQWKLHAAARQADLKDGPTKIGVGGARGPGKSHGIFAQVTIDDSQRVPNLKGLFLRQTGKAAKESMEDLVVKVLSGNIEFELASGVIRFPNGSRVVLGGFKDEKDIDKYVGIEYDWIAVEEINQLTETKVKMLLGSMRTTKTNWRPRLYGSFNPGGMGHAYVKKTFVLPHKLNQEKDTRFIPANYKDNPGLDEGYINYLLSLDGQLGQAWREGDFDVMAGQFFPEWNEKIHVIDPIDIPKDWLRIAFLDYGHTAQSALYWASIDPQGKMYVYRELYKTGLTFSSLADEWVSHTPANEEIDYLVADPSIWAKKGENAFGLSGAEIFQQRVKELTKKDIRLERANNDRFNGWAAVREYLKPFIEQNKTISKLRVFSTCVNLIRTFPDQVHDINNPEDLDTTQEDHALDSLRYGIMSKPEPKKISEYVQEEEKPLYSDIGI